MYHMNSPLHSPIPFNLPAQDKVICNLKVLVLGDKQVGKTSIVYNTNYNQNDNNKDHIDLESINTSKYMSAISVDFMHKKINIDNNEINIRLWDTTDMESLNIFGQVFFKHCHVALLIFDINKPDTFNKVKEFHHQLQRVQARWTLKGLTYAVIANKMDLYNQNRRKSSLTIPNLTKRHSMNLKK